MCDPTLPVPAGQPFMVSLSNHHPDPVQDHPELGEGCIR